MEDYRQREIEKKLRFICDEVDDYLEDTYGHLYPLHPVRPSRGRTANKAYDGLFNVATSFTPGFGSELGRGYLVIIHMATLKNVSEDINEKITYESLILISKKLKEVFPERELKISRDGRSLKITGDFSLGYV